MVTYVATTTGKDGANIPLSSAQSTMQYTSSTWTTTVWTFTDVAFPVLKPATKPTYASPAVVDYSPWVIDAGRMGGSFISLLDAKKRATYLANTWVFDKVWSIREGIEFPRLLTKGDVHSLPGNPGESNKWNVFVKASDYGSMSYNNELYESLRIGQHISMYKGATGEIVTQTYEGEKVSAGDGKAYVFLASGVQDPDYPGGYGFYTSEISRNVTLRADRSNNVNFYYVAMAEPEFPPYNYLMRVSVPDGIAHIAVLKEDVSAINVQMHDGSICTVDIVSVDDVNASVIRVSLPEGIFALKQVVV